MTQREVDFTSSDGTTLRGVLHLPAASASVPGVVMTHGFSAVKEMGLPPFAEAICDAGIAVLLYDHRGLGASDGEPRGQINPWAQMHDMQQALTWLGTRPEVDAGRLGLWGSSFSGGEVLVLGAVDERVRAVVANVPFAGLPGADYETGTDTVVAAIAAALDDGSLADGTAATVFGPMAVVNEEGTELSAFLGQPESSEWFLAAGASTSWRNEVTLANAFGTEPPFDPGACAAHLRCPTLFVVASEDHVAEAAIALAAYERAPEPKELLVIDGHHFTPYAGAPQREASAAAVAWFGSHLFD
ncbi:MAG: CocE/NonD family hydrolase [Acidimicrobiales bacterium]